MMLKKRMMSVLMIGVLSAGALAGCGENGTSASGSAASNGKASTDEMTFVMAARNEFMSTLESAMIAEGEKLGYRVTTQDAQNDAAKQIQYIETCANAGNQAAIILPVDADAAQSLVDAAGEMKLVFVNRPPTDLHVLDPENVAYVGSDEDTSGYMQGEYLAEYFKGKGKDKIKYLMLQGTLGQVATTKRSEGILQALKDNGIQAEEASAPLVADWDRPTAQTKISPLLSSGIDFDCIMSNNDSMALGAIEACDDIGITVDFPIVGIDCTADGAQAVADGRMAMTLFQDPVGQGKGALMAAINLIEGKPINEGLEYALDDSGESYSDSIVWVPFEIVTKDNVADYMK
ncbi:substrate-binding domain-containing protein [Butyricicoccus sp.]|uniref:sugar ABC transporter substrate-binding protein n=1 Tax=Butyricicoccus sp. TaxID=2049021 RepID=UPI003F152612